VVTGYVQFPQFHVGTDEDSLLNLHGKSEAHTCTATTCSAWANQSESGGSNSYRCHTATLGKEKDLSGSGNAINPTHVHVPQMMYRLRDHVIGE
jgi:hypothetical protein